MGHTFASLPREDQSLLILHYMLGLPDEVISRHTGIPSREVRLRRELGKAALAERAAKASRPRR